MLQSTLRLQFSAELCEPTNFAFSVRVAITHSKETHQPLANKHCAFFYSWNSIWSKFSFQSVCFFPLNGIMYYYYYYLSAFCYNLSFETRPERTTVAAPSLTNRKKKCRMPALIKLDERERERAEMLLLLLFFFFIRF